MNYSLNKFHGAVAVLAVVLGTASVAQATPAFQYKIPMPRIGASTQAGTGATNPDVSGSPSGTGGGTTSPVQPADSAPALSNSTVLSEVVVLAPLSLDFGGIKMNETSAYQTLTLRSNSAKTMAFQVSSTDARVGQSNDCAAVVPGGSCSINVNFNPRTKRAYTEAIGVTATSFTGALTARVVGDGLEATGALAANDGTDFGVVRIGTFTLRSFSFTNTGNYASLDSYVRLDAEGAYLVNNTCGTIAAKVNVQIGDTCSFVVKYEPTTVSTVRGGIAIIGDFIGSPSLFNLTGSSWLFDVKGAWSTTVATTSSINRYSFGSLPLNSTATQSLYLRNAGTSGPLTAGFTLNGDEKAKFKILSIAAVDQAGSTIACLNGSGVVAVDGSSTSVCVTEDVSKNLHSHIKLVIQYHSTVGGVDRITMAPATDNGSILPADLTLSGAGDPDL